MLADNRKMTDLTDWLSEVSFPEGWARTVDWIVRNMTFFDPDRYAV